MRNSIIRFYWDDEQTPSVEAPVVIFSAAAGGNIATGNRWPFV